MTTPTDPCGTHLVHTLRNYAMVADGERGALIGPSGDIAWMCAPRWQDDAIFSSLIGGSGRYAVTPTGARFVHGGQYEDGTLIWRSRWVSTDGILECRQALAIPAEEDRAVLLRRIRLVSGSVPVRITLDGRPGFGKHTMRWSRVDDETWTATGGDLALRIRGLDSARVEHGALLRDLDPEPGTYYDLVLEISGGELPRNPLDASALWRMTEQEWANRVPQMRGSVAPDDSRQSWAVLRGMTSSTGAMVAAATMALPERAEAKRNYDYRYAWIRDQCFAGQAASAAGMTGLLDSAVRFTTERLLADGDQLKPAYTILGGPVPDERHLDLKGYPGGSDRLGNWVNQQFQLDAFGECLLLLAEAARHDRLDVENWHAVEQAVRAVEKRWQDTGARIWELNDEKWTHSRLICVAGLRAVARHAPAADAARWEVLADTILAATARECVHPSGRWQRSPDDERVDAALLLPPLRGALPPDDARTIATLAAVREELESEGYVYRFRHDKRPLAEAEGAFLLSGFNMALAQHQQGNELEAFRLFERNRAACGSPGLFTEEYDIEQRQLRGNLPQAFVHAAMVETAHRLANAPGHYGV